MQTEIKFDCPECGYTVKSEILEVLTEPKYKVPGKYKCHCPICNNDVEISGKNPKTGFTRNKNLWSTKKSGYSFKNRSYE